MKAILNRKQYENHIKNGDLIELENITETQNIKDKIRTYYRCETISRSKIKQIIVGVLN